MMDLPIWRECRRCTHFVSTPEWDRCTDPFPPSGQCPLTGQRNITIDHPYAYEAHSSHKYADLLENDACAASIFQRWRRGDLPNDSDFLYLRELALHPDHFLKDETPMHFLQDVLLDTLVVIIGNFGTYNLSIPRPESNQDPTGHLHAALLSSVRENVQAAFGFAVYHADPFFIENHAGMGSEWSRFVVDLIRAMIWHLHDCKHKDFSRKNDKEFRVLFEQEWNELMRYQDGFYGFGVTPRISINDMVRYQNLNQGKAQIRRAISAYLNHQATEYPHILKPFAPKFTEVAFERPIRESYGDLIHALTNQALLNLYGDQPHSAHQSPEERKIIDADIQQQLWKLFDEAREQYEFYWNYPGRKRPLGKVGFVGLQTNVQKEELDRLAAERGLPIRSKDISEVAFAHFIHQKLRYWVRSNYPADSGIDADTTLDAPVDGSGTTVADNLSGTTSWNLDNGTLYEPASTFPGIDGLQYITINQAVKRWGLTLDQLRRLDREGLLRSARAKDVCQQPCKLSGDVRLYPLTPEMDRAMLVAKLRLATHSSRLEGQEVSRKTAASIVGVSQAALRQWEDKGLVQPIRKGKIVVYNEETLEQAKRVKLRNG